MVRVSNKVDVLDAYRNGPGTDGADPGPGSPTQDKSSNHYRHYGSAGSSSSASKKLDPGAASTNPKAMSAMLDSSRVRALTPYFNYSTMISHAIEDQFEGNVRGKLDSDRSSFYDNLLLYLAYFYCFRCMLLTFVEHLEYRAWLGETERVRPYRQMVMVFTIWSVYVCVNLKNLAPNAIKLVPLTWLEPFQVLRGETTPQTYGLTEEMLHGWHAYTLSMFRFYFAFGTAIIVNLGLFLIYLVRHRWNWYPGEEQDTWANTLLILWTVVGIAWTYMGVTLTYVLFVYFNSLCYYFKMRYEKVNQDIETIITQRLKANERVAMLHHILVEHNALCLKVSEYNKYWARFLMSTYFFLIAIICFTAFQAFFTANLIIVRLLMFWTAGICGFIITRLSISAAVMSNKAHEPYSRLIRVTFEKYPVELQIQLRMFIQRTSGPTIGFYCLDVFEITYTTYASILAALGQNFLLIVDFVRSYAEVGKEYDEINFADINMLTGSVFNSTLDVLDEMTGTNLASAIRHTSNESFF